MKMGEKPILIVFEGVDKSGKTTLLNEFNKTTGFGYVVLDRLTTSSKVYNELFQRDRLEYYNRFEEQVVTSFNTLVVLCESNDDVVRSRLKKAGEVLPKQLEDIELVKKKFEEYVDASFANYVILDTSVLSVKECVERIVERVKEMEM